ncbi:DUF6671 family protein [Legionella sp. W05-934-2]|uniref:DUF6671 family protein n=1 Tax=Legionella sp. W05-934-2 TaxID=1198649 RepID=UPI00346222CA
MYYKDKKVLLATKHEKEKVIKPPFEQNLGCHIHVPDDYDTDQFGTFSGEIPRTASAYETLILKAKKAAQAYAYQYCISSEGSFGPHPQIYFCPADTELMAFIDLENDLIIMEYELTTKTNFNHIDIRANDNFEGFLKTVKFPSHGMIVRTLDSENEMIEKGIQEYTRLKEIIRKAFDYSSIIRLETDMRAMMNPLRMQVIGILAKKLVKRIQQRCPHCQTPGFGEVSTQGFLNCSYCGTQTGLYKNQVLSCLKCEYKTYNKREDGKEFAEQSYCPHCNP